jgi:hypothetical protein
MRGRLTLGSVFVALVFVGCSVEAPEYRATPVPPRPSAVAATPDVQPLTYEVIPLPPESATASVSKTVILFSNPNAFVLDWFMTVRFTSADGKDVRDDRIGSAGVPPDRADPKFGNWYFPIPPGDSPTVVRSDRTFAKADVQEFKVARSITTIGEISPLVVASKTCANDADVGVIGCDVALDATEDAPAFSKLHLVVLARSKASRGVIRALQWRPELTTPDRPPWLRAAQGETLRINMHDSYPTPADAWEYDVFAHVYRYSSQ